MFGNVMDRGGRRSDVCGRVVLTMFRRRSVNCQSLGARWAGQDRGAPERSEGQSSRQSDSAHHTEEVTVHYPWHPLHGRTILVRRSVRHGRELWVCEHDQHTAAIPLWMTDRVACAALSIGPVFVSVEASPSLRRW